MLRNLQKNVYSRFFSSYRKGDNVYIKYDPDLEAYILTNKDLDINDDINQDWEILVLRKFDNVVLYNKIFTSCSKRVDGFNSIYEKDKYLKSFGEFSEKIRNYFTRCKRRIDK
jgi:hypothetical protein